MLSSEMSCKCEIPGQGMLFEHHCKCFSSSCCLRFQRSSVNTGYEDTLITHGTGGQRCQVPRWGPNVTLFCLVFSFHVNLTLKSANQQKAQHTLFCAGPLGVKEPANPTEGLPFKSQLVFSDQSLMKNSTA